MNKVKGEMTLRVAFVLESDKIDKAFETMKVLNMHHVPVVRDRKVIGMLSDRDILLHAHLKNGATVVPDKLVSEVMGKRLVMCNPETSIATVAEMMLSQHIHALPVVDKDGKLVGIITSSDLIRILRDGEWLNNSTRPFLFESPKSLFGFAS